MTNEITNIWNEFHNELKGFIRSKTRNAADTDDILQEVFVKIIRNIEKVNKSKNLRQYIYGIVRNTVSDYFRNKINSTPFNENFEHFSEPDTQSLNITIAECCVRPFINQLPEHYKDALLITEFQNVSQKDLAEKLNISYSGAKSRVQRGKDKLKSMILDCCVYESDVYGNLIDNEKNDCSCS